jgi:hypothetical protein
MIFQDLSAFNKYQHLLYVFISNSHQHWVPAVKMTQFGSAAVTETFRKHSHWFSLKNLRKTPAGSILRMYNPEFLIGT